MPKPSIISVPIARKKMMPKRFTDTKLIPPPKKKLCQDMFDGILKQGTRYNTSLSPIWGFSDNRNPVD